MTLAAVSALACVLALFSALSAWTRYRKYREVRVLARGSFGTAVLLRCPRMGVPHFQSAVATAREQAQAPGVGAP